jgi:hypothetical protein
MGGYKKNDRVFIRDYPFGVPTNVFGEIVGVLENDCFNVKIENGWNEGKIILFKYWKLIKISEMQKNSCKNKKETVL